MDNDYIFFLNFVKSPSKTKSTPRKGYFNEGFSRMMKKMVKNYGYEYFLKGLNFSQPSLLDLVLDYIDLLNDEILEEEKETYKLQAQMSAFGKQNFAKERELFDFDFEALKKYLAKNNLQKFYKEMF